MRHIVRRVRRHRARLWIPPHRATGTAGIHNHGGVRAVGYRRSIRVVEQLTGLPVASVPVVDHQCRRSRPHPADHVVQCGELIRDRTSVGVSMQAITDPLGSPGETSEFATGVVDSAVGQAVPPSWCTDPWIAIERG